MSLAVLGASILLALLLFTPGAAGAAGTVRQSVLPSGLKVVLEHRPSSEMTGVALALHAGSRFETASTIGAARMLSNLYLQGTAGYPSRSALLSPIFGSGGYITATPHWESITLLASVPADFTSVVVERLGDIARRPLLQSEGFRHEQQAIELALDEEGDDPSERAIRLLFRAVLGSADDLGYPGGSAVAVRSLTVNTVREYHRSLVGANRAAVAIVSPLSPDQILVDVERAFTDFGSAPGAAGMSLDLKNVSGKRLDAESDGDRALVLIGIPIPGADDVDRPVMDVIIGALDGSSGRLFQELRVDEGIVYSTGVTITPAASPNLGLLIVQALSTSADADYVLDLLKNELAKLGTESLTESALSRAIGVARGSIRVASERAADRAAQLAAEALTGEPVRFSDYDFQLGKVTSTDVRRVAHQYLIRSRMYEVVVRT